jgi:hypothetical protein
MRKQISLHIHKPTDTLVEHEPEPVVETLVTPSAAEVEARLSKELEGTDILHFWIAGPSHMPTLVGCLQVPTSSCPKIRRAACQLHKPYRKQCLVRSCSLRPNAHKAHIACRRIGDCTCANVCAPSLVGFRWHASTSPTSSKLKFLISWPRVCKLPARATHRCHICLRHS